MKSFDCIAMQQTGTEWLCQEVFSLFSDQPTCFKALMGTHGVLLSSDIIQFIINRAQIDGEKPSGFSLRAYVVAHRLQSFVEHLCVQHGYDFREAVSCPERDHVFVTRRGIGLLLIRVTVDLQSAFSLIDLGEQWRLEQEASAFVSVVYQLEASVSGRVAVHLMSDWVAVCLPLGLSLVELGSRLLPVARGVCSAEQGLCVFPDRGPAYVMTEVELNAEQERCLAEGRLLAPGPAELWVLRSSLLFEVFKKDLSGIAGKT